MAATWSSTWAERGRADSAVTVGRRGERAIFDMGCMVNQCVEDSSVEKK